MNYLKLIKPTKLEQTGKLTSWQNKLRLLLLLLLLVLRLPLMLMGAMIRGKYDRRHRDRCLFRPNAPQLINWLRFATRLQSTRTTNYRIAFLSTNALARDPAVWPAGNNCHIYTKHNSTEHSSVAFKFFAAVVVEFTATKVTLVGVAMTNWIAMIINIKPKRIQLNQSHIN